jgi:hypothetical protein
MIYVRIELWPLGDLAKARVIGEAQIANDATSSDPAMGNYQVRLFDRLNKTNLSRVWSEGRVEGFRRQSLQQGHWDLLFRALLVTVGRRNLACLSG